MSSETPALEQQGIQCESDWLWTFLVEQTGEDRFFDAILGRGGGTHPPHPENVFETDRVRMFREIVVSLIELRGSEEEAARWLFRNDAFEQAGGGAPFEYLEDGEFQALALLHAWLQVACLAARQTLASSDTLPDAFQTATI